MSQPTMRPGTQRARAGMRASASARKASTSPRQTGCVRSACPRARRRRCKKGCVQGGCGKTMCGEGDGQGRARGRGCGRPAYSLHERGAGCARRWPRKKRFVINSGAHLLATSVTTKSVPTPASATPTITCCHTPSQSLHWKSCAGSIASRGDGDDDGSDRSVCDDRRQQSGRGRSLLGRE